MPKPVRPSPFPLAVLATALPVLAACPDRAVTAVPPMAHGQTRTVVTISQGGLPSIHLGVVSTNVGARGGVGPGQPCSDEGDDGRLRAAPRIAGCTPPTDVPYILDVSDADGNSRRNYQGALEDTFACIAALGTSGCGLEQPLEAMRRALDGRNGDFLRPEAYLGVVFIGDEDDCSMTTPDFVTGDDADLGPLQTSWRCFEWGVTCEPGIDRAAGKTYENCRPRANSPFLADPAVYADFLRDLKADPAKIVVAGIIGPTTPVRSVSTDDGVALAPACTAPGEEEGAAPAIRLGALIRAFPGNRASTTSICENDLTPALEQIAAIMTKLFGNPCLEGVPDLTDVRPDAPGLQLDCAVTEISAPRTLDEQQLVLPRCAMDPAAPDAVAAASPRPCYAVVEDATCTRSAHHLAVLVERPAGTAPPLEAELVMDCTAAED